MAHRLKEEDIELETWDTDFEKNVFQKETLLMKQDNEALAKTKEGRREGRNEHGETWNEKWYALTDGTSEGWSRETEKDEGNTKVKLGEG